MSGIIKNQIDSSLTKKVESEAIITKIIDPQVPDSQVQIKKKHSTRRSFDTAYKLRILAAYNACENALQRGALLRKEGLYYSRICAWRERLENSKLNIKKQAGNTTRTDHLTRENEQLKKKLAHAEAIIDLQKKISELLGVRTHPTE